MASRSHYEATLLENRHLLTDETRLQVKLLAQFLLSCGLIEQPSHDRQAERVRENLKEAGCAA